MNLTLSFFFEWDFLETLGAGLEVELAFIKISRKFTNGESKKKHQQMVKKLLIFSCLLKSLLKLIICLYLELLKKNVSILETQNHITNSVLELTCHLILKNL